MLANIFKAAEFVNAALGYTEINPGPVKWIHLVVNVIGLSEFRIYKNTWPKRDTQKVALEKMTKTMGDCTRSHGSVHIQTYEWDINEKRRVSLIWKHGRGTFIRLEDFSGDRK